jgi:hypothetical protein
MQITNDQLTNPVNYRQYVDNTWRTTRGQHVDTHHSVIIRQNMGVLDFRKAPSKKAVQVQVEVQVEVQVCHSVSMGKQNMETKHGHPYRHAFTK